VRARDNPFATHHLHALRLRLPAGDGWDLLLARFAALGHRAAVVGGEGRGKTALLDALAPRLAARGFTLRRVTVAEAAGRLPTNEERELTAGLAAHDLIVVDGVDQLGRAAWLRLRRQSRVAGGLLVASHRPGLLPTLVECVTSAALLAELVAELTAGRRCPPLPPAAELFARHRGNLREALRELYDRCAGRPAGGS
jgi:hypothetical protein